MVGERSGVLVAATVLVTALAGCGSGAEVASRTEPVTLQRGLENLTPDTKLPPYPALVIAPTSDGVLVVMSRTDHAQGSVSGYRYDEARHELVKIAPPPFSPAAEFMSGVWTGNELVVVAWLCSRRPEDDERPCSQGSLVATSYNPGDNTWTQLPRPPGGAVGLPIGWIGHEAVFSLGTELNAFDPATYSWRKIPDPPPGPEQARVCRTDRGLVASWIKPIDFGPDYMRPYFDQAISFAFMENGAATWEPIETPPIAVRANEANMLNAVCGDTSLLVVNRWLDSVWLYELDARQWRAVPRPPIDMVVSYPSGATSQIILDYRAWTGREYLLDTIAHPESPAVALDPRTTTWRKVQPGPDDPSFDPNGLLTTWRDGTVFGSGLYLWSWTPPDFDGIVPPFPAPQTGPPVPVPNQ
jgi:hypothetical protein